MEKSECITQWLTRCLDGDRQAADRVLPIVYGELRGIAERHLRRERGDHTLQPTALVHEAFLRLQELREIKWKERAHFFAVASSMIRRVLVDHARARNRKRRSAEGRRVTLSSDWAEAPTLEVEVLALNEALDQLAAMDARQSQIVELRFFGGLTVDEAAEVMKLSPRTVKSEWASARAWLYQRLKFE